jgi:hypothetical protein
MILVDNNDLQCMYYLHLDNLDLFQSKCRSHNFVYPMEEYCKSIMEFHQQVPYLLAYNIFRSHKDLWGLDIL